MRSILIISDGNQVNAQIFNYPNNIDFVWTDMQKAATILKQSIDEYNLKKLWKDDTGFQGKSTEDKPISKEERKDRILDEINVLKLELKALQTS